MSLEAFIAAMQAIPDSPHPEQALAVCREEMQVRVKSAETLAEKREAYEYYKAFYELRPYSAEAELEMTELAYSFFDNANDNSA